MNKNKSFIAKVLSFTLILLGLILCLLFLYLNFIRGRLPRDIPFIFTEFRFYVILYLLYLYLFIIKQHIYYKPPKPMILKIMSIITTPFIFFDSFFKHNKYMYNYYFKVVVYISRLVHKSIVIHDTMLLFFVFNLMPRIILLLIFMVDVFWLKKIEVFYYCIILSAIPLTYNYIKYSIEFAIEQYTEQLEIRYEHVAIVEEGNFRLNDVNISEEDYKEYSYGKHNPNAIYHDTEVTVRRYLEIQAETLLFFFKNNNENFYEYVGTAFAKDEVYEAYSKETNKKPKDLKAADFEIIRSTFYLLEFRIIFLSILVKLIKSLSDLDIIKKINLIIYSLYFITWLYIFILSISSLSDISVTLKVLQIMTEYSNVFDPFS